MADNTHDKLRWGILSTANIGRIAVIPAIHESSISEVVAVASRVLGRAREFAQENGISNAFGSYEELLEDDELSDPWNPFPPGYGEDVNKE